MSGSTLPDIHSRACRCIKIHIVYLFLYPTTADDTAHREVFHVHTICFFFYMDRQDHHAHREPLSMFFVAFGFDMFLFFSLVTILVRLFFFLLDFFSLSF